MLAGAGPAGATKSLYSGLDMKDLPADAKESLVNSKVNLTNKRQPLALTFSIALVFVFSPVL